MIIVEGPDGSGKDTLIGQLDEHLPLELVPRHCDSKGGPFPNLAGWVSDDLLNRPAEPETQGHSWIYNRYPLISEPIYGVITRGEPQAEFQDIRWFYNSWAMFLNRRPLIVICLPPYETARGNLDNDDDQMSGVVENYKAIYCSYVAQAAKLLHESHVRNTFHVRIHDYTIDSPKAVAKHYNYTKVLQE